MSMIFCSPRIPVKELSLGTGETFKVKYSDDAYFEIVRSTADTNIVALKLPNKWGNFAYLYINDMLNGVVVKQNLSDVK